MSAKVTIHKTTVEVPVYAKLGGREIEIGTVEVDVNAHVETVATGDDSDDEGASGEDAHTD